MHVGANDPVRRVGRAGDAALDLRVVDALGQDGERLRRLVAGLHLERGPVDGAAVEPRRRSGLEPAERKARRARACATGRAPAPRRRGRPASCCSPIWMRPRRNVPVVSTTAPAPSSRPSASLTPATRPLRDHEIIGLGLDHREVRGAADRLLHGGGVELAVGLRARPAHRRPLAPVEHPELDAAAVGDASHQAVERVDLAHEMALAEAADRRDCTTWRRWWRSDGSPARSGRPCAPPPPRPRSRRARHPRRSRQSRSRQIRNPSASLRRELLSDLTVSVQFKRSAHAQMRARGESKELGPESLRDVSRETPAQMVNEWLRDMVNESLRPKRRSLSRAAPPTSAIDPMASDPLGRWLSPRRYLPMQKSRKITSRTSSTSTRPVNRSSARVAIRTCSAISSSRPSEP